MSRAQNRQAEAIIRKAAIGLIVEKGYEDTSYSDIAKAAGYTRSYIQYYFPKKERIALLFDEVTCKCIEMLFGTRWTGKSSIHQMILAFRICLELMTYNEGARKVTLDILNNRRLSKELIIFSAEKTLEYHNVPEGKEQNFLDIYSFACGGAHELVQQRISDGAPIDAEKITEITVSTILTFAFDYSKAEIDEAIHSCSLSADDVKVARDLYTELLFEASWPYSQV